MYNLFYQIQYIGSGRKSFMISVYRKKEVYIRDNILTTVSLLRFTDCFHECSRIRQTEIEHDG